MGDKRDPYKMRPTRPNLPRATLPPPPAGVTDEAAAHWDPNAATLEECPACKSCTVCGGGAKLVPGEVAQAYRASAREEDGDASGS